MFERVSQKLCVGLDVQCFHHSILVKGYSAGLYIDLTCHLLHPLLGRNLLGWIASHNDELDYIHAVNAFIDGYPLVSQLALPQRIHRGTHQRQRFYRDA